MKMRIPTLRTSHHITAQNITSQHSTEHHITSQHSTASRFITVNITVRY